MKYIYLLLLILIIFYLFKNIYQKYSNQENFDPSLVPVSSIVTLAKVAQKLVDGGGTLTNPGNLQIGLPSAGALGNLYVTGTNTVDGNTAIKGTTSIDSLLTANGGISTTTIGATNNIAANSLSTTNGNVSINNGTINLTSDGTGGLYFLNSGTTASPVYNRLYMGPTNVTGNFNASGNAIIDGNSSIGGSLDIMGNSSIGGSLDITGQLNANGNVVIKNSNLTAPKDLNILLPNGQLNINNAWGGSGNMNVSGNVVVNGTINSYGFSFNANLRNQNSKKFLTLDANNNIVLIDTKPSNPALNFFFPMNNMSIVIIKHISTNLFITINAKGGGNGFNPWQTNNTEGSISNMHSISFNWNFTNDVVNPKNLFKRSIPTIRINPGIGNGCFTMRGTDGSIDCWANCWANCWGNECKDDCTWEFVDISV